MILSAHDRFSSLLELTKARWRWVKENYDFNAHPGMGTTAYYYYLQTAASALEAYCLSPIGIGERDKMLRLRCTSGFLWTYSACPFGEQGI